MATPVLLADERRGRGGPAGPPPARASGAGGTTPEQGAEALRPYLDAGFTGFTFNNPVLPTVEAIGLAGEVLRLIKAA